MIDIEKHLTLDDNKRMWNGKFEYDTLNYSDPKRIIEDREIYEKAKKYHYVLERKGIVRRHPRASLEFFTRRQ